MDIKTIKRFIRNIILFIILIVLTFWIFFKDQDMNELINTIKSVNPMYILIAIKKSLLYQMIIVKK